MKLINYGSSSRGNLCVLQGFDESILLDCGIDCKPINYELMDLNVAGILLTHSHGDHIKGIKTGSYLAGGKFYASKETFEKLPKLHSFEKVEVEQMKRYNVGNEFSIIPISVSHDVPCFAYIIRNKRSGISVLYATDLGYADSLTFKNIHTFIIESNYIRSEIDFSEFKNYRSDSYEGHLALEDTVELLKRSINVNSKNVFLSHITHSESNYKRYEELAKSELNRVEIRITALNNRVIGKEVFEL